MIGGTALLVPSPSPWNRGRLGVPACAAARSGRWVGAWRCPAITMLDANRRAEPEPLVIGERAAVLHHGDPGRLEDARDLLVADPELEPHDLGPRLHRQDVLDVLR